jgi:hypothetical protein
MTCPKNMISIKKEMTRRTWKWKMARERPILTTTTTTTTTRTIIRICPGATSENNSSTQDKESELNYTEVKFFHCMMPCSKGRAAVFTFPKEYLVTGTVIIMGLIPYTKNLYGDEVKKWFGWSPLGREEGS